MSYILDALKKADAARERESVPGLHSRHDAPLHAEDDAPDTAPQADTPHLGRRGHRPSHGVVAGMVGGAALAALFAWWWQPDAADTPVAQTAAVTAPAQPSATQTVAQTEAPSATPPATPAPVLPPSPAPVVAPTPTPAPAPAPTPALPAPKPAEPAPLRVDPSLKDPAPRVVSYQELPDDIKRELPALNVGGAMHSEVAANRMLILNGGLFREGEQPAPGLVLEEIKLKSAVFSYKGHRYSVAY